MHISTIIQRLFIWNCLRRFPSFPGILGASYILGLIGSQVPPHPHGCAHAQGVWIRRDAADARDRDRQRVAEVNLTTQGNVVFFLVGIMSVFFTLPSGVSPSDFLYVYSLCLFWWFFLVFVFCSAPILLGIITTHQKSIRFKSVFLVHVKS